MLIAGIWIAVQLEYLLDRSDNFRLGLLIFFSVIFGVGLAQWPPARFLLMGRASKGRATDSETHIST